MCICVHHDMVPWCLSGGRDNIWEWVPSLHHVDSGGMNSGLQAWWEMPLPDVLLRSPMSPCYSSFLGFCCLNLYNTLPPPMLFPFLPLPILHNQDSRDFSLSPQIQHSFSPELTPRAFRRGELWQAPFTKLSGHYAYETSLLRQDCICVKMGKWLSPREGSL